MQISRGAASAIALASVLAAGLLGATPALATKVSSGGSDYVFDFSALCADCTAAVKNGPPEYGEGVLTLKDVTDLSSLTNGDFVEFTYDSSLVGHIDITSVSAFSGDFSDLSQVNVDIVSASWSFTTQTTEGVQSWSLDETKTSHPADYGTAYGWTAGSVPEPAAWALMIVGFGLAGAGLRVGRRQVARAV